MKIIKKSEKIEKQVKCNHCKTVIAYTPNDVFEENLNVFLRNYIKCPECNRRIYTTIFNTKII